MTATLCPCQSQRPYADCCAPLHQGTPAPDAQTLMRSRYSAYTLHNIPYLVASTVPAQQALLDTAAMQTWAQQTQWLGLEILHQQQFGKHHAQVAFNAHFQADGGTQVHHELSTFVHIAGHWYFIDPTVPLPSMKQTCFCGSGKKFKHCCGAFFR